MTTAKRLTISISQIAPLVGLDAYNNFPRIICEIWRKYDPNDFKTFETMLKLKGLKIATSSDMNDIWEADEELGTNILEQVKHEHIEQVDEVRPRGNAGLGLPNAF